MMRALGLFALAVGLLILPRLSAQEPARDDAHSSHRLDFLSMPEGNLDDLLRQRLAAKQLKGLNPNFKAEDIDKLKEKLQDPAFLKQLENLPPGMRDLLKGMSAEQIKEKLSPEILDQVKAQLQKQADTDPQGGPGSQKPEETPTTPKAAQTGPAPSQQPVSDAAGSEAATEDALANSKMGDLFERFARKVDPKWRDSPAAHRFLQALSERMGEKDERWEQLAKGAASMADKWADLGRSLHLERVVTGERANWLARLLPEKLPARIARRLSDTLPAPGAGAPGLGGSAITGSWSWLTTPAAIGLLGLILWLALKRYAGNEDAIARARRSLGPWPVDPATVSSREDLIRAFEYLSLLRIGQAARNWNHRHIARELNPPQTELAQEIATLYERARYAPSEDALAENTFDQARRGLCALAGAGGR
jgi:hypothetical protein